MELNSKLLKLQGVLKSHESINYVKIKYKGGNEEKIQTIIEALQGFLKANHIVIGNKLDIKYTQEFKEIVAFLIVNTEFKEEDVFENLPDYRAFINAAPKLSLCLVANIVVELDFAPYYCSLINTIPYFLTVELLGEVLVCIKHCEPKKCLNSTYTFLNAVINIVSSLDVQEEPRKDEIVDKISDISVEMLNNLCGIQSQWLEKWKKHQIHKHIGFTLFYLLKLLNNCSLNSPSLSRIIDNLIRVSVQIVQTVTVNVFCVWAEVQHENDQPLQITISAEAYLIIERFNKYKPAKELLQILGNIAQKPKTLSDLILEADTETIITKINQCDENQKHWFKALVRSTSVFQNEKSLECLDKWAKLCSQEDVYRLLSVGLANKEPRIKYLLLKCAQSLTITELAYLTSNYLRDFNSINLNWGCVENEARLLLNKTETSLDTDEVIKGIYLLFLQNPEQTATILFFEGLKKSAYLKKIFETFKDALEIHQLANKVLLKLFECEPPTLENIGNFKDFLNMLLGLNYFHGNLIVRDIFIPQIEGCLDSKEKDEMFVSLLRLLNLIELEHDLNKQILPLMYYFGRILEEKRCQFFTFSLINQDIIEETTQFLLKCKEETPRGWQFEENLSELKLSNPLNKYYFESFYGTPAQYFLSYLHPTINEENAKALLIQLLPTCVLHEWNLIASALIQQFSYKKAVELLEHSIMLLCEVTKSQAQDTEYKGLKFCLRQYGIVVKTLMKQKSAGLEEDVLLTKSICRIIKMIPNHIRKEEGLQLAGLISDDSLQSLKQDRPFILLLVAIQETTISQFLAQKILC